MHYVLVVVVSYPGDWHLRVSHGVRLIVDTSGGRTQISWLGRYMHNSTTVLDPCRVLLLLLLLLDWIPGAAEITVVRV